MNAWKNGDTVTVRKVVRVGERVLKIGERGRIADIPKIDARYVSDAAVGFICRVEFDGGYLLTITSEKTFNSMFNKSHGCES